MSDRPTSGRRLSGWMKALLTLGALVLLLALGVVIIDLVGGTRLQVQLDAVRATGDPLTPEELEARRRTVPDDRNGALILQRLCTPLLALSKDRATGVPFLGDARLAPPGEPLDAAMVEASRVLLTRQTELLDGLEGILACPTGRYPLDLTSDPFNAAVTDRNVALRTAVRLEALGAWLKASEGRLDAAALDTQRIFNLAATLDEGGTLIAALVATSADILAVRSLERTLSFGVLPITTVERMTSSIEARERAQALVWGVWGERAWMCAAFDQMRAGKWTAAAPPALAINVPAPLYGWTRLEQAKVLSLMHRLVEAAKAPAEKLAMVDQVDRELASLSRMYVMTRALVPSLKRVFVLWIARDAELRSARVALAVERFRLRHAEWPESLDVLVPDLLAAVPTDPFDGQPLRYKLTDEKVTIYSVGENQRDDGGDVEPPQRGRAPDLGFRLLRPDLRVVRIRESADTQPSDANSSGQ